MALDWWDDWYCTYGWYKFLHVDTYGRHFNDLCRPMSDAEFELLMFGSHDLFSCKKQHNWGFLSLTEPLSPNAVVPSTVHDCFRLIMLVPIETRIYLLFLILELLFQCHLMSMTLLLGNLRTQMT